jgi:hypothetical protein
MELKESALATIFIFLFTLSMGILTGGILFYTVAALSALLIITDYYSLIRAKRDILANVEIKSGLSRNEVYLGASTQLVCRLVNNGSIGHQLQVKSRLDDSIRSDGVWKPIQLPSGSTVYLKMMLEPTAGGMFTLEPSDIFIESWLFKDSFPYGKRVANAVKTQYSSFTCRSIELIEKNANRGRLARAIFPEEGKDTSGRHPQI